MKKYSLIAVICLLLFLCSCKAIDGENVNSKNIFTNPLYEWGKVTGNTINIMLARISSQMELYGYRTELEDIIMQILSAHIREHLHMENANV